MIYFGRVLQWNRMINSTQRRERGIAGVTTYRGSVRPQRCSNTVKLALQYVGGTRLNDAGPGNGNRRRYCTTHHNLGWIEAQDHLVLRQEWSPEDEIIVEYVHDIKIAMLTDRLIDNVSLAAIVDLRARALDSQLDRQGFLELVALDAQLMGELGRHEVCERTGVK